MNISRTRRLGVILFFAGFIIGIPGVMLMLLPNRYEATAKFEAMVQMPSTNSPEKFSSVGLLEDEFKTIKSDAILNKVIETLHLEDEWGKRYNHEKNLQSGEALLLLKQSVHVQSVTNTRLIELQVTSEIPEEAANIANSIAMTYLDYKWDQSQRRYDKPSVAEPARPPTAPTGENRPGKILVGAGIFLILVGLRFLWRAYFAAPRA